MEKIAVVSLLLVLTNALGDEQFCYECSSKSALCRYSVYDGQYLSRIPCRTNCFLRTEGNTVYRGCFDGWLGGVVEHKYVGCRTQQYLGEQIEWCFCKSSAQESYGQPCNGASRDALSKMALPKVDLDPEEAKPQPPEHQSEKPQLNNAQDKTFEYLPEQNLDADVKYFIPTASRVEEHTEAALSDDKQNNDENMLSYDIQFEDNLDNIVLNDEYAATLNIADKTLKDETPEIGEDPRDQPDMSLEKRAQIGDDAEGVEICITQPDGTYSDPNDCTKYYSCSNSLPYKMSCSQGTVWNDRIKSCTFTMTPSDPCRSPGLYNKLFNRFTQEAQQKLAHYKYGYKDRFETAWSSPND